MVATGGLLVSYNKDKAKQLLVHYFRLLFEKNGMRMDSDNIAEIEEIIELIWEGKQ